MANTTYVFGGYTNSNYRHTDTIEKYEQGKWVLLETKLPAPIVGAGVITVGSSFMIFGGQGAGNKSQFAVYKWNLADVWEDCEPLESSGSYMMNHWVVRDNEVHGYDVRGERVKYIIRN